MPKRYRSMYPDDGGVFFVTTSFRKKRRLLSAPKYYDVIIRSLIFLKEKYGFEIWAYVLMPSHIHLVIAFAGKNRLSVVMRDFKKSTSYELRRVLRAGGHEDIVQSLINPDGRGRVFQVWEDRFDDLVLYSTSVINTKINYIHNNPVRAGLCAEPGDWPYSSARQYAGGEGPLPVAVHELY